MEAGLFFRNPHWRKGVGGHCALAILVPCWLIKVNFPNKTQPV